MAQATEEQLKNMYTQYAASRGAPLAETDVDDETVEAELKEHAEKLAKAEPEESFGMPVMGDEEKANLVSAYQQYARGRMAAG